ncbi:hypothetical protein V8F33_006347 [Rhypophila sp. PSN 637]
MTTSPNTAVAPQTHSLPKLRESEPPKRTKPVRILLITATHLVPDTLYRDRQAFLLNICKDKINFLSRLVYEHHWAGTRGFDATTDRQASYNCVFGFSRRKCYFLVDHLGHDGKGGIVWKQGMQPPPIVQYRWDGTKITDDPFIGKRVLHYLTFIYPFPRPQNDPWYFLMEARILSILWENKGKLINCRLQLLNWLSCLCFPEWELIRRLLVCPGAGHMEWIQERLAEKGEAGRRISSMFQEWLHHLLRLHGGLGVWDVSFSKMPQVKIPTLTLSRKRRI